MAKHQRSEYRRRRDKTVWHFMTTCRFWPALYKKTPDVIRNDVISRKERPKDGTLCDHCQNLEKKKAA